MSKLRIDWDEQPWPNLHVAYGRSYAHAQLLQVPEPTLYLHDIYTCDDRHQGIGRIMLKAVIAEGLDREVPRFAATPVTPDGQEFFEHLLEDSQIRVRRGDTVELPLEQFASILGVRARR